MMVKPGMAKASAFRNFIETLKLNRHLLRRKSWDVNFNPNFMFKDLDLRDT